MKMLAIIPARGGSKGIPRKNVLRLGGRPLIAWTIEAAISSGVFEKVIVSTDDDEIAEIGCRYGAEVPFRRPFHLAGDDATSLSVVRHAVEWSVAAMKDPSAVVLLQPTSPFRSADDIRHAAVLATEVIGGAAQNVVSVTKSTHDPKWSFWIDRASCLQSVFAGDRSARRQDSNDIYYPNGAIYVSSIDHILRGGSWYDAPVLAYVMPEERSIDIDTPWGLEVARAMVSRVRNSNESE